MSVAITQKNGSSNKPVSRLLNIQKTKNTRRNYFTTLKQFFRFIEGEPITRERTPNDDAALAALDASAVAYLESVRVGDRSAANDLIDFIATLTNEGYAPSSVLGARAGVNGFFELNEVELSRLNEKVIKRVLPKYSTVYEEENITIEIMRAMMQHMNTRDRAVMLTMLSTGGRPGETLALRLRDVDLESLPARVTFRAKSTKTNVKRTSFLTPEAVEALQAWLKVRDAYIKTSTARTRGLVTMGRAKVKSPDDDRLFPFALTTFAQGWNKALKKAGLYETCEQTGKVTIHPHGLRKFFRTYFGAAAGVDVAEKLMGHEGYLSGAYVRLTEADLAAAYEKHSHVLMVARGASGELLRQVADQREAVKALEADNAALREELEAANARQAEINARTQAEINAYLNSPLMVAMRQMNISPDKIKGGKLTAVKFDTPQGD